MTEQTTITVKGQRQPRPWKDCVIYNTKLLEDDYNSYNYDLIDNSLTLKEEIIQPYFITQNPDRLQEIDGNASLEVVYPTSVMEGYNIQSALTL